MATICTGQQQIHYKWAVSPPAWFSHWHTLNSSRKCLWHIIHYVLVEKRDTCNVKFWKLKSILKSKLFSVHTCSDCNTCALFISNRIFLIHTSHTEWRRFEQYFYHDERIIKRSTICFRIPVAFQKTNY